MSVDKELSPKEREVVDLVVRGLSNKQIALYRSSFTLIKEVR